MWAEYVHNNLHNASTVLSHFKAQVGYQPPLFVEQEKDIGVPPLHLGEGLVTRPGCRARDQSPKLSQQGGQQMHVSSDGKQILETNSDLIQAGRNVEIHNNGESKLYTNLYSQQKA